MPVSPQPDPCSGNESTSEMHPDPTLEHSTSYPELSLIRGDLSADDLLNHYAKYIAPIMVWLDSPTNAYKVLVLPLARDQPVLSLAIQAVSAAHLMENGHLDDGSAGTLYEKCVMMIASLVGSFATSQPRAGNNDASEAVLKGLLASTLVLSNHSLLFSHTQAAQMHKQAARTLLCTISTFPKLLDDDTFIFLRSQLFTYDVLACTTICDTEQIMNTVILPQGSDDKMFLRHHLALIHSVTIESIQGRDTETYDTNAVIMDYIDKFELAMGLDFAGASALTRGESDIAQRNYARLVQVFHHASILYMCRKLSINKCKEAEHYHAVRLFASLERFHDINILLHNLAWPLLIAGTVSQHDTDRQNMVRRLFVSIGSRTVFKHHSQTLKFLEELWSIDGANWLDLAQQYEKRGEPIVAD